VNQIGHLSGGATVGEAVARNPKLRPICDETEHEGNVGEEVIARLRSKSKTETKTSLRDQVLDRVADMVARHEFPEIFAGQKPLPDKPEWIDGIDHDEVAMYELAGDMDLSPDDLPLMGSREADLAAMGDYRYKVVLTEMAIEIAREENNPQWPYTAWSFLPPEFIEKIVSFGDVRGALEMFDPHISDKQDHENFKVSISGLERAVWVQSGFEMLRRWLEKWKRYGVANDGEAGREYRDVPFWKMDPVAVTVPAEDSDEEHDAI